MPIVMALDANHDGVISADEIANAPAALKTLDKNGDGQLTKDEYLPPVQTKVMAMARKTAHRPATRRSNRVNRAKTNIPARCRPSSPRWTRMATG